MEFFRETFMGCFFRSYFRHEASIKSAFWAVYAKKMQASHINAQGTTIDLSVLLRFFFLHHVEMIYLEMKVKSNFEWKCAKNASLLLVSQYKKILHFDDR